MSEVDLLAETKKKLDRVSSSFCLAKWLQVSIHLQNGQTHSCHHPPSHVIPLDEISRNPDALHNTEHKKQARKQMLEGKRPPECDYCWKVEDISPTLFSDRVLKSNSSWAMPDFEKISAGSWDEHVTPAYLEVSFSSTCNFKCAYCSPHISSKWMEEIKAHGAYPTRAKFNGLESLAAKHQLPIPEHEHNPYVDAFWKWWPELYPKLKVFRITGGEPLLTRHTFRVLEYVEANPRPDLELAINSNLGVPRDLIERFADRIESITRAGKVKSFTLFTSIDTWGEQAEYIRYGMQFDQFRDNVHYLLNRLDQMQLGFICTFNALSPPGILRLVEWVAELKRQCPRVEIDFPYLKNPQFLSAKILPAEFTKPVEESLAYVKGRMGPDGFRETERVKLERLLEWMKAPTDPLWIQNVRGDFYRFITTYDQRRELRFQNVFPELAEFLELCEDTLMKNASYFKPAE